MNDLQADRLFDSILAKVEKRLGRRLKVSFNKLSTLILQLISEGGQISGNVAVLQYEDELTQILTESYEESIREGVIFTRRDLELPPEGDDSMIEEVLFLLLLWKDTQARTQSKLLIKTTIKIYNDAFKKAEDLGLTDTAKSKFISREFNKANRGRIETIATTEAGEAVSRGSLEAAEVESNNEKPVLKRWRSQRDSVVRDTHIRTDRRYSREPIGLRELFEVGASKGPYPRSSMLSIVERINCRCYMRFVKSGE